MSRGKQVLAGRDGLVQVAVVLVSFGGYEALRMLIKPDWPRALHNAREVASLERVLGIDWEGAIQQTFLSVPDLIHALNVFYLAGHFGLTAVFFLWLYHTSRDGFRLYRDAFLVATALAILVHWMFPTAPPRLAGLGIEDTLLALSGIDIGSPASSPFSNPVAAVPSLHAAYALGVALGLIRYGSSALKVVGVLYPPLVLLTIVVTGNHFLFDALAGIAVLGVGFAAAATRRSGRLQTKPPEGCYTH
jgi:PAP2 superfamily